MTVFRRPAFTRICAAVLAAALALQPLAAYAAPITPTLAEVPIQGLNPVKPNIMFTMDDSGSMGGTSCRTTSRTSASGICALPRRHAMRRRDVARRAPGTRSASTIRRSAAATTTASSTIPSATYRPGKKADGTDLPCEGADATCGAPWTSVYINGFAGYPGANTGGRSI